MKKTKKNKENSEKEIEYIKDLDEIEGHIQGKIKNLKEKLKNCQKEKEEYLRGWQRERADFINYRNEEERRKKDFVFYSKKKIISELLLVLDNLERAEKEIPEEIKDNKWVRGIIGIKKQLHDFLTKEGLEEIKDNEEFNPEIHEAVEMGEGEEDKILKVLQKGYFLEGKILRPARVKVGKKSYSK